MKKSQKPINRKENEKKKYNYSVRANTLYMRKKAKMRSFFGAGLLALWLAVAPLKGDIKEITKPYLGVYECKSIQIADHEWLSKEQKVVLELKKKGIFTLYYQKPDGNTGRLDGRYKYEEKTQQIQLLWEGNNLFKQSFPIKNGQIIIQYQLGTRIYRAIFEQK